MRMTDQQTNIAPLRKKKKLSQQKLAELAEVSQATISRLEKGEQEINVKTLAKIARALDVELTELAPPDVLNSKAAAQDGFYAFCPNPFCRLNRRQLENGEATVRFSSGSSHASGEWTEINFCRSCGTDMVKECPSCKLRLKEHARFCTRCGHELTSRPTPEEWKQIREEFDDIPF